MVGPMGYEDFDDDGADEFVEKRRQTFRRSYVAAWKPAISSTRADMRAPVVYFHPVKDVNDADADGVVFPKLYKKFELSKEKKRHVKHIRKLHWRGLSNKLKKQWKHRGVARDEAGNVTAGVYNRPGAVPFWKMRSQRFLKKNHRSPRGM